MSGEQFDTIVVGARCAGAPLATLLARAGQRVLLLDADKLPSDQPLSTHYIHAIGVDWLDEIGAGARVRALSPPSRVARVHVGDAILDLPYARGRAAHCIRRFVLDGLLQEGAVAAGAELRDRSKVIGLLREGERVAGVEVEAQDKRYTARARIVVGADGRHSTVARLTGAKEYHAYDAPRFAYWGYWPAPPAWKQDAELAKFDSYLGCLRDGSSRAIFQTDGDLLLLGAAPLLSELAAWREDHEAAYVAALRRDPTTAKLVEGNQREGKLIGIKKARFFFRDPVGPGFALVGDAALHKDPTSGFGITDAVRDARSLSAAILDGSERAFARYHRQRDVESIELFHFAKDMGAVDYANPFNETLYRNAARSPALLARLAASTDREISPNAVLPAATVLGWVLREALRGRFDVVRGFIAAAKRGAEVERLVREHVALRDAVG